MHMIDTKCSRGRLCTFCKNMCCISSDYKGAVYTGKFASWHAKERSASGSMNSKVSYVLSTNRDADGYGEQEALQSPSKRRKMLDTTWHVLLDAVCGR